MSRMVIPTMDVVRFKEADVLCASGIVHQNKAMLSGWGDGINGNAELTFKNGTETSYSWTTLNNEAKEGMLSGLAFIRGENGTTLEALGLDENMSSDWNGTYEKQEDNKWHWQHQ